MVGTARKARLCPPYHSIRAGRAHNSNGQRSPPSPCEEPAAASLPASRRVRAAHSASSFETRARLRARNSKDCVPCPPLPRGHGARGQACRDCVECPARAFAHPTNVDAQIRRCRGLGTPGLARSCGPIPCGPMSSPGIGTRRPRGKSSRARGWAWAVDAGNRLASPAMVCKVPDLQCIMAAAHVRLSEARGCSTLRPCCIASGTQAPQPVIL